MLFSPLKSDSFSLIAVCIILATVCDFPEPVEPTIAICLLKNLLPSTGTLMLWFVDNTEKQNCFCLLIECSNMLFISSSLAGSTSFGGIVNVSPPLSNFSPLIIYNGIIN